jgi:hypothetical protein
MKEPNETKIEKGEIEPSWVNNEASIADRRDALGFL